jgi:hypothetical protein
MNVKKESQRLTDLNNNIEVLENTKTFHPFAMAYILHTNKHLADKKETEILNFLMS